MDANSGDAHRIFDAYSCGCFVGMVGMPMIRRKGLESFPARIDSARNRQKPEPVDLSIYPVQLRQDPDDHTGLGGWLLVGQTPEDVWRQYTERKAVEENGPKDTNTMVASSQRPIGQYQLSGEPQE